MEKPSEPFRVQLGSFLATREQENDNTRDEEDDSQNEENEGDNPTQEEDNQKENKAYKSEGEMSNGCGLGNAAPWEWCAIVSESVVPRDAKDNRGHTRGG